MVIGFAISYMLNASLILFIGIVSDEENGCDRVTALGRFIGASLWPITLPTVVAAALLERARTLQRRRPPAILAHRPERRGRQAPASRVLEKFK